MTTVITKQPGEKKLVTFAFASSLASAATIATVVGVTPTSNALVSGSSLVSAATPAISGTDVTSLVDGGTDKEAYGLRCVITDSSGQTLELDHVLLVIAEPVDATLVVEDGTGLATANSLATVAEADAYLRARARAATWDTHSVGTKAAYLIGATEYLSAHVHWKGSRVDDVQALDWPRDGVNDAYGYTVAVDAVPSKVKHAVIEIAAQGPISTTTTRLKRSVTVGPIATVYEGGGDPTQNATRYRYALRLVEGLVVGGAGGSSLQMVRA